MTTKFFLRRARSGLRTTTANKLIATIAVLGAAASIAGLATFATFTSTTSSSHTISSGTVTIALGATGASTNRLNIGASAVAPALVEPRFDSVRLLPITAREARTDDVEPPQV